MTLTDFLVHEATAARAAPGVIVKLTRAFDVWRWLCPRHIELARLKGWKLVERREPPHPLPCEDCA